MNTARRSTTLDSRCKTCVYSSVATHIIIDVEGPTGEPADHALLTANGRGNAGQIDLIDP